MFNTVTYIEKELKHRVSHRDTKVMYLCGTDHVLKGVSLWKLKHNGIIVVARSGYSNQETEKEIEKYNSTTSHPWIHLIPDKLSDISSTNVRKSLKRSLVPTNQLPSSVNNYLSQDSKIH
jgi:nicotinic acid mononucleotide adenylyltransferase